MHTHIYAWSFGAAAGMVVRGACDACGGGQVTCVVREETDRRHHPPSMSTDVTNVTGAMYQCALHNLNIYIEEERDKTQTCINVTSSIIWQLPTPRKSDSDENQRDV